MILYVRMYVLFILLISFMWCQEKLENMKNDRATRQDMYNNSTPCFTHRCFVESYLNLNRPIDLLLARMVGDLKNKISEMDKLYNELLTSQQNACAVGAPSRLTEFVQHVLHINVGSSRDPSTCQRALKLHSLAVKRREIWRFSSSNAPSKM